MSVSTSKPAGSAPSSVPAAGGISAVPTDIVPLRHPMRWVAAGVVILLAAMLAYSVATNPNFGWPTFLQYLFAPPILEGLRTTLLLTVTSMTLGIILGIVLAAARMSPNPVLATLSGAYLWLFRGTPLLVQLIFWYNLSALYPRLALSVPFGGPEIAGVSTNAVLTLWPVAIIGLTLNEGAYMAEIARGGLLSVSRHQSEAAAALGMSRSLTFRRVVLPQALKVIVPPTGNQVIGMLKNSSLVSAIALADLLYAAQQIYANNFQTIPLLLVACFWYLVCTTVLSAIQRRIEQHYGRGTQQGPPPKGFLGGLFSRFRPVPRAELETRPVNTIDPGAGQ